MPIRTSPHPPTRFRRRCSALVGVIVVVMVSPSPLDTVLAAGPGAPLPWSLRRVFRGHVRRSIAVTENGGRTCQSRFTVLTCEKAPPHAAMRGAERIRGAYSGAYTG